MPASATVEQRLTAIADRFHAAFPSEKPVPRRVGREAEYPLVDAAGRAADAAVLWPLLLDEGEPIHDLAHPTGDLLVGVRTAVWTATAEVGRGTVEVSVGPRTSLHELAADLDTALVDLVAAARGLGLRLLGHGIQPVSRARVGLMTPKRRYASLHAALGQRWLPFCVTASDQLHVDVTRDELIPLTNHLNAVSGALIATCANSAVYDGRPGRFASGREGRMAFDGEDRYRHGAVPRTFADVSDYVRFIAGSRCLCLPDGRGGYPLVGIPFREHLSAITGDDEAGLYEAFLFHNHYLWPSARPRARLGTLEIRPSCQQPPEDSWAGAAFALGLVEARQSVQILLHDELGDRAWGALARHREAAVRSGLAAAPPFEGYLPGLVLAASDGLRRRALGEASLLEPVYARLERRSEPAARARKLVAAKGVAALVHALSIDTS